MDLQQKANIAQKVNVGKEEVQQIFQPGQEIGRELPRESSTAHIPPEQRTAVPIDRTGAPLGQPGTAVPSGGTAPTTSTTPLERPVTSNIPSSMGRTGTTAPLQETVAPSGTTTSSLRETTTTAPLQGTASGTTTTSLRESTTTIPSGTTTSSLRETTTTAPLGTTTAPVGTTVPSQTGTVPPVSSQGMSGGPMRPQGPLDSNLTAHHVTGNPLVDTAMGLRSGKPPGNDLLQGTLETTKQTLAGQEAREWDPQTRQTAHKMEQVVTDTQAVLSEKNADEKLQRFLLNARKAEQELSTSGKMRQRSLKGRMRQPDAQQKKQEFQVFQTLHF